MAHVNNNNGLYIAQKAGIEAVSDYWFPRYDKSYRELQEGLWKVPVSIYRHTYNFISTVAEYGSLLSNFSIQTIRSIANGFFRLEKCILNLGETRFGIFYYANIYTPLITTICPLYEGSVRTS